MQPMSFASRIREAYEQSLGSAVRDVVRQALAACASSTSFFTPDMRHALSSGTHSRIRRPEHLLVLETWLLGSDYKRLSNDYRRRLNPSPGRLNTP